MRKEVEMKFVLTEEDFGLEMEFVLTEEVETAYEMEQLYNELFDEVHEALRLGCSVSKTDINKWPAIHIEDPDTQITIPVIINGMNHFT